MSAVLLTSVESTSTANATAPDWSTVAHEPQCPFCGYNVRGLLEARCPECGRRFSWWEVLDPNRATHPYLFEHHPDRGVRSFWKTALMTNFPAHFWRTLSPAHAPRVWRLLLYVLIVLMLMLTPLVAIGVRQIHAVFTLPLRWQPDWRTPWADTAELYAPSGRLGNTLLAMPIGSMLAATSTLPGLVMMNAAFAIEWGLGTFVTMLIFQQSLGKRGIRMSHVARVIVYCSDFAIWAAIALCIALTLQPIADELNTSLAPIFAFTGVAGLLYWPVTVYRMFYAFRHYLRIDRPIVSVLIVQCVVAILTLLTLSLLNEFFRHFS
jgi:hypothetical protein